MGGEVAVADEAGEVGGVGFVGARGFVADGVRSSKEAREVGRHCWGRGSFWEGCWEFCGGVMVGFGLLVCEGDERWLSVSRLCGKSEGEGVFGRKRKKEKIRHECCSE